MESGDLHALNTILSDYCKYFSNGKHADPPRDTLFTLFSVAVALRLKSITNEVKIS